MLSHHNILFVAATASALRGIGPSDRLYGVLPLAHIVGFATVLMSTLLCGGSVFLAMRFQPEALLAMLERERITRFLGEPAMFHRILEHCAINGFNHLALLVLSCTEISAKNQRAHQTYEKADAFSGGTASRACLVRGFIRAGRAQEVKEELLRQLSELWTRVSGVSSENLLASLAENAGTNVMASS